VSRADDRLPVVRPRADLLFVGVSGVSASRGASPIQAAVLARFRRSESDRCSDEEVQSLATEDRDGHGSPRSCLVRDGAVVRDAEHHIGAADREQDGDS
jgi:hypothetical protein